MAAGLQQSTGENKHGKISHSKIFTFIRHFMIILKRILVVRASIFHHITDTDNAGPRISDLTLLNDA